MIHKFSVALFPAERAQRINGLKQRNLVVCVCVCMCDVNANVTPVTEESLPPVKAFTGTG